MISRTHRHLIALLVTLTVLLISPSNNHADLLDLQEFDFEGNTIADTFITRDNRTGLEWLDIDLFINMTFEQQNELITTGIYSGYGFRFAKREEFQGLITTVYGATLPITITGDSDLPLAPGFLDIIGTTREGSTPGYWAGGCYGRLQESAYGSGFHDYGYISHVHDYEIGYTTHINIGEGQPDDLAGGTGAFFVREFDSIPEPSTILLIGTGLVGLLGFRRKFRN